MTLDELRDLTRRTWEPYAGHPLSDAEVEEILTNATAFVSLLLDWQTTPSSDNAPVAAGGGRAGEPPLDKSA